MNEFLPFGLRIGLLFVLLGLAGCVSDALPRDDDGPRDGASDATDARPGDVRFDAIDASAPSDTGGTIDVTGDATEAGAIDVRSDIVGNDAGTDGGDVRADGSDVSTDPVVIDTATDMGATDRGADVVDAGTAPDTADSGGITDATDVGTNLDASDVSADVSIDGGTQDAAPIDAGADTDDAANTGDGDSGGDARADTSDSSDGGGLVFYEENFDTNLGTFSSPVAVCGTTIPEWTNVSGYAHASEPINVGVSRITSPVVTVPANTSNVTLRMSHRFNIETGWDCGQLLISKNGGAATQVTTFVSGGYLNGGQMNAATCQQSDLPGQYPGWSGNQTEMVSAVNLSAAPFSVQPGDTVSITFRMATDELTGGVGWDINWVTLSANSP